MANQKRLIIFILIIVNYTRCYFIENVNKQVEQINNENRKIYGDITKENINLRNFDVEEKLSFPRGDKGKLSKISQLWRAYYACAVNLQNRLTSTRQLPSAITMVYQGAVARLPCIVCVAPGERELLKWMYAESTETLNFTQVEDRERLVFEDGNLAIYNVMPDDAGAYRCQVGSTEGGLVVLEVVDTEEAYNVVKPATSRGPHASPPDKYKDITLFSLWSPWSECSECGQVGRRHRYGLCFVKLNQNSITKRTNKPMAIEQQTEFIDLDSNLIELFEAFPDGIPCRSRYLPHTIRRLDVVQLRPSEIMIGLCKVHCSVATFYAKELTNETFGTNSCGTQTYSLTQRLPKQPALPARDTIFADFGQPIAIRCPGTILRDVPIQWRIGTKYLVPRDVDKVTGGRVHINSRSHLVFTTVLYSDADLYSCWQAGNLAGSVKLIVWAGAHAQWNHHVTLVMLVVVATLLHRTAEQGLRSIQRRQSILYHLY